MSRRVYFIRPIGMRGPVKIGHSCAPDGRRRSLAAWSPFSLEIVAEIEGDAELERRFHTAFATAHERGEWFTWSPELQAVVDAVAAGTFDINTLPEPRQLARKPKSMAFLTEGWRYERSVDSRLQNMRRRGLEFREIDAAGLWTLLHHAPTLDEAKAAVEPLMAAWAERFPSATMRRRQPKRFNSSTSALIPGGREPGLACAELSAPESSQ